METCKLINWGIVGAGSWMEQYHLPVLRQLYDKKKIYLKSIWNRSIDKAIRLSRKFGIEQVCSTFEELICEPSIGGITIVLQKDVCTPYIRSIAKAGIPFLAEKPPAESYASAQDLLRNIGTLPHIIGFNRRFLPLVETLTHLLPKALTGYQFDMWRRDREDPHYIFETGIHVINLAEYLFGPLAKVQLVRKWISGNYNQSILLKMTHHSCEGFIDFQPKAGCNKEKLRIRSKDNILNVSFRLPFVSRQKNKIEIFENGEWREFTIDESRQSDLDLFGLSGEYYELLDSIKSGKKTRSTIQSSLSSLQVAQWAENAVVGDSLHIGCSSE